MDVQTQSPRIQNWLSSAPAEVQIAEVLSGVPGLDVENAIRSPVGRTSDGSLSFRMLLQPTIGGADAVVSIPDALGINGETQIGLARGEARIMSSGQDCWFCSEEADSYKEAPPYNEPGMAAFLINNSRPFGPLVHAMVCTTEHRENFSELELKDLQDSTELFYRLARSEWDPPTGRVDGLTIGQNYGRYDKCGASQPHFHFQIAGLSRGNYNAGDRLGALCRAYARANGGADYMGDYIKLLNQSNLILIEDKYSIAYSPISPRFIGEAQVMLKRPDAGNILDTTREERDSLAAMQLDVIRRFDAMKIGAMNQVWYMTRFSAQNDYGQRLVVSLVPRTAVYAFYELSGNMVVDALPWMAAEKFRGNGNGNGNGRG